MGFSSRAAYVVGSEFDLGVKGSGIGMRWCFDLPSLLFPTQKLVQSIDCRDRLFVVSGGALCPHLYMLRNGNDSLHASGFLRGISAFVDADNENSSLAFSGVDDCCCDAATGRDFGCFSTNDMVADMAARAICMGRSDYHLGVDSDSICFAVVVLWGACA